MLNLQLRLVIGYYYYHTDIKLQIQQNERSLGYSSAWGVNDFFGDDVDAGLVSFNPINIGQQQGIFGIDNEDGEDSIGGIFAGEELTGRDTFDDFTVGGNLFVGGGDDDDQGDDDDDQGEGNAFFDQSFQDNIVDTISIYSSGNEDQQDQQVGQFQQQLQQGLLDLFN